MPSKLDTYTYVLANQAIHPFGVGQLIPTICRSNSDVSSVRDGEVGG